MLDHAVSISFNTLAPPIIHSTAPFDDGTMLFLQTAAPLELTTSIVVVFGIIIVALIFFMFELLPIDVTAIGIMLIVIILEPWTKISPEEGISGFSSKATITVLAMFILSEGIRRTGLLQRIGNKIVEYTGGNPFKQYSALIGVSGLTAGFINNTPVVAMMVPIVVNVAKKTRTSPSKYLMPVSYAAMMGGMLTVIGTSTNILASDVSARLIGHPFAMFEFTPLGLLVLLSGWLYLLTIGRHLTPERIKPEEELTETFEMARYLTETVVQDDSPFIGRTIGEVLERLGLDIDVVRMSRNGEAFIGPLDNKQFRAGDTLIIRANRDNLLEFMQLSGFRPATKVPVREQDLEADETGGRPIELVILSDSELVGETLQSLNFAENFNATVLAIRRGGEFFHDRIGEVRLRGGDTLLVQALDTAIQRLANDRRFIVTQEKEVPEFRTSKIPHVIVIVTAVVVLAALNVVPILVAALAGVLAMVITDCVRPSELYDAVNWDVIFLLAGVIPLGMALEQSGGAEYVAYRIVEYLHTLPPLMMLAAFYLLTALVTQVISNNASVVLMIPVAVNAATEIGGNPFSFVLAVTFAASTAMLSPVGYQTNLMVYGPGGYKFADFFRVGALLQILLALVTSAGIYFFWGI